MLLIATGIFFRFANLDHKIYGYDESITLVRVAGFTTGEVRQALFSGREVQISEIQKFQRLNTERDLTHTVRSLALEVPQHAPLYFIMARVWAEWFGTSVATTKTLPALLSLLMFPCLYWLCRELFSSSLVAWMAVAVTAISPFHLLYAQEARPYTLLSVATLLSGAALLRAIRKQTKLSWITYAAAVTFGLYSQLLFALVFLGHGIYVMITERLRASAVSIGYAAASLAALAMFAPWLLIVVSSLPRVEKTMSWTATALPFSAMVKAWIGNLSRLFVDSGRMGPDLERDLVLLVVLGVLTVIFLGLTLYSLWFLYHNTPIRVWSFLLILIGVSSLTLIIADFILGRHLSTVGRYLMPSFLGLQIAVAYVLSEKIKLASGSAWARGVWGQITTAVALSGIASCTLMSQSAVWWNWGPPFYYYPSVARIINQSSQPLLVSDGPAMEILSLSYLLDPKTRIQLVSKPTPEISVAGKDVFLFRPSQALRLELQKDYKLEPLDRGGELWQLKRASNSESG